MRISIVLLGVGVACVTLALLFLTQERSARAAQAARAERIEAVEAAARQATGASELLTAPAHPVDPVPLTDGARAEGRAELGSAPAVSADILAELVRAREAGLLDDAQLVDFLVGTYLVNGDPRRAVELLRTFGSDDHDLWWNAAQMLGGVGDPAAQREFVLVALERWPESELLLDQLLALDPARAITHLGALLAAQPPPGDPALQARLVHALAASGDRAAALAQAEALVAANPENLDALMQLAQLDPEGALARLEGLLAELPDREAIRRTMLDVTLGAGNADAAQGVLERFEREGQAIEPDEWGAVAELWQSQGEPALATSAYRRALEREHGDPDGWVHPLEALAPAELCHELERRIAGDEARNDEFWGSLADSYWRSGRSGDARAAWEQAMELDPSDREWPARLDALRAGRDPYAGG